MSSQYSPAGKTWKHCRQAESEPYRCLMTPESWNNGGSGSPPSSTLSPGRARGYGLIEFIRVPAWSRHLGCPSAINGYKAEVLWENIKKKEIKQGLDEGNENLRTKAP